MENNVLSVKDMKTGEQKEMSLEELIRLLEQN
jgi:histidyl-tRNA synthetase